MMSCPNCGAPDTYVARTVGVRRERRCAVCRHAFDTVEIPAEKTRQMAFKATMYDMVKRDNGKGRTWQTKPKTNRRS